MHIPANTRCASRSRVLVALAVGLAGTALMLTVVLALAHGETAAHARLHVVSSATVMAAAAIVALLWRHPRRRTESLTRTALISTLILLASAQLAESGGALAWSSDGQTLDSPALGILHTAANVIGAAALLGVAASSVACAGALVIRFAPVLRVGSTVLLAAVALAAAAGCAQASSILLVAGGTSPSWSPAR